MRVEAMVREVVRGCSSVVHAARLEAVIKVVEGIVPGGRLSPATIGRNLPRLGSPEARHQVCRPPAGQSAHGWRSAAHLPGDRASPATRVLRGR